MNVTHIVINNFKNDSRVLKETASLKNHGYKINVVALKDDSVCEEEVFNSIEVRRIKLATKNIGKNALCQILKYIEFVVKAIKYCKDSDVVHCHDLNALPVGVIAKRRSKRKVKLIYDAHEYEINDGPNQSKFHIKMKYYIERFFIKHADKLITVSDGIAKEYQTLYSLPKPTLIFNTPHFHKVQINDKFREKFNIDSAIKIFLYQGGFRADRGIVKIIEAFKKRPQNAVLVLMGYGPLEDYVKQVANEFDNIYFHEAVSPQILLDYTASADFGFSFVDDSSKNNLYALPNKFFEYMMAEIPVLTSNSIEMAALVKKYNIGLSTDLSSVDKLYQDINELVNKDYKTMTKNISLMKNEYNWQAQENKLLAIYDELGVV
jgi:glycosyltransferase involved in cell wall biosynthesis